LDESPQFLAWARRLWLVRLRLRPGQRHVQRRIEICRHRQRAARLRRQARPALPANREKALFFHIWNYARDKGITNLPNPCADIKGFKEAGRDAYIVDQAFSAVWEAAQS